MKVLTISLLFVASLFACRNKKKEGREEKNIFSVVSFLKSQAKIIDSSNYSLTKIQSVSRSFDTLVISKEEFRKYANEFINLPDISLRSDNYEISKSYDSMLNNLVVTYITINPKEEVTRETILWEPDSLGNSKVKTVYIHRIQEINKTIREKELTWQINRGFQIITKTQLPDQSEKVDIVQVQWK